MAARRGPSLDSRPPPSDTRLGRAPGPVGGFGDCAVHSGGPLL